MDGRYRDVFIVGYLDDMMVAVSHYSVWEFLDSCRLLSSVSSGLIWDHRKIRKQQYF